MNPYSPYSTPPAYTGGYPFSATPSPAGSPSSGQHGYYARPTTARPTPARPSSRQQQQQTHSRHTSTSAGDAWGYSPRGAFSPRYNSSGHYATAANVSRKQSSWSPPPPRPARRNSYSYRASYGDSDEDDYEYIDYFADGVCYREYVRRPAKSSYHYRGRGTDQYYYSQAQGFAHDDEDDDDFESSPPRYESPPPPRPQPQPTKEHRRPSTSMPKQKPSSTRPTTARPTPARPTPARPSSSSKKPVPPPAKPSKATEADARKHRIPPGYSLKNWDPSEEPIMLLGSVFDANSLGKWVYDWTVYHHGPATPMADMAGELWLLLIQLAGKVKRAEECMDRIRTKENREMVDDFIESGERLTDKLKKLLKACETPMLKAGKKTKESSQLGKNAGTEFVDSIFGRDRQLDATEKFMSSIRLWNLRFDANCEDILRRPGQ